MTHEARMAVIAFGIEVVETLLQAGEYADAQYYARVVRHEILMAESRLLRKRKSK